MTDRLESKIAKYLEGILRRGGAIAGIDQGFIRDELAESAFRHHKEIASGERPLVGVNFKPRPAEAPPSGTFALPSSTLDEVLRALTATRTNRNPLLVRAALLEVESAAKEGRNTIPALIAAVRARASLGEMTETLAGVFGRYTSTVEYGEAPARLPA